MVFLTKINLHCQGLYVLYIWPAYTYVYMYVSHACTSGHRHESSIAIYEVVNANKSKRNKIFKIKV